MNLVTLCLGSQSHWGRGGGRQCFTIKVICLLGLPNPLTVRTVAQSESQVALKIIMPQDMDLWVQRSLGFDISPSDVNGLRTTGCHPTVLSQLTIVRTLWDPLFPSPHRYIGLSQRNTFQQALTATVYLVLSRHPAQWSLFHQYYIISLSSPPSEVAASTSWKN